MNSVAVTMMRGAWRREGNSRSENPRLLPYFLRHIKAEPTAARPTSLEPCLSRINCKATQPVLHRVGI